MLRVLSVTLMLLVPLPYFTGKVTLGPAGADRVEADWQLILATPDPDLTCPQLSTTMKLDATNSSPFCVFSLNYQDFPSFIPGGVQAKILQGDQTLVSSTQGTGQFQTAGETVTWTQRLSLSGGNLNFKITGGQSTTWGPFGSTDTQLALTAPTPIAVLDNYSPDVSVASSGPSFGDNRVSSMTLLQVRYYQGQTLLATDTTARTVKLAN